MSTLAKIIGVVSKIGHTKEILKDIDPRGPLKSKIF